MCKCIDGIVTRIGKNRVGEASQGGRNRCLETGSHRDVVGNEPADSATTRDRIASVLRLQRRRQGRDTSGESIALALQSVQSFPISVDR